MFVRERNCCHNQFTMDGQAHPAKRPRAADEPAAGAHKKPRRKPIRLADVPDNITSVSRLLKFRTGKHDLSALFNHSRKFMCAVSKFLAMGKRRAGKTMGALFHALYRLDIEESYQPRGDIAQYSLYAVDGERFCLRRTVHMFLLYRWSEELWESVRRYPHLLWWDAARYEQRAAMDPVLRKWTDVLWDGCADWWVWRHHYITRRSDCDLSIAYVNACGVNARELMAFCEHALQREVPTERALEEAARHGQLEVVRHLTRSTFGKYRDRMQRVTSEALYAACRHGHTGIVQELLTRDEVRVEFQDDIAFTCLLAIDAGHVAVVRVLMTLFDQDAFQHTYPNMFAKACALDNVDMVDMMLSHPKLNTSMNDGLVHACKHGAMRVIQRLLTLPGEKRADISAHDFRALREACQHAQVDVVKRFVESARPVHAKLLGWACSGWQVSEQRMQLVQYILGLPGTHAGADDNAAIRHAAKEGHAELVKLLLARDDVDPTARDNEALRDAASCNRMDIVELLLSCPAVAPMVHEGEVFYAACQSSGGTKAVSMMLPRITTAVASEGLVRALGNDCLGTAQLLLDWEGVDGAVVDPTVHHNKAIQLASLFGHAAVVRQLLSLTGTRRVDPTANKNMAMCNACEKGHTEVVALLLRLEDDRRVDLRDREYRAIRKACANNHAGVVKLLHTRAPRETELLCSRINTPLFNSLFPSRV